LTVEQEIYVEPYDSIDWPSKRNHIAAVDYLVPHSYFLDACYMMMGLTIEKFPIPPINRRALDKMYEQVVFEDENTDYFDLTSVSNLLQMLCRAHREGQNCEAVKKHLITLKEFIWMGPDGMQFTVTNGCQVWDTAFIVLGLIDSGLSEVEENQESLLRVLHWLDEEQITENTRY
jgi:lanosterol synthase